MHMCSVHDSTSVLKTAAGVRGLNDTYVGCPVGAFDDEVSSTNWKPHKNVPL